MNQGIVYVDEVLQPSVPHKEVPIAETTSENSRKILRKNPRIHLDKPLHMES